MMGRLLGGACVLASSLALFGCTGGGGEEGGAASADGGTPPLDDGGLAPDAARPDFDGIECGRLTPLRGWSTSPSAVAVLFTAEDCTDAADPQPIAGLRGGDFFIQEDAERVSAEAHRDILPSRGMRIVVELMLDTSDSTLPNRAEIIIGAQRLVDELLVARELADRVKVGVQLFDGSPTPRRWVKATADADGLKARLAELSDYTAPDGAATNLNGAVRQGVESLALALDDVMRRNQDGVVATGHLVVFTDGGDSAGRETAARASAAVASARVLDISGGSPSPVVQSWAVALRGEDYDPAAFGELMGEARYITEAASGGEVASAFARMGERVARQVQGTYLFAYCSTKRAGTHEVSVRLKDELVEQSSGLGFTFDASGFGGGCNAAFFETACEAKDCGGFNCGACDDEVGYCDPQRLTCVDFCAELEVATCETTTFTNANGYEQTCEFGADDIRCDGVCVDGATSNAHCGRCGNACSAAGSWCEGGECVCAGGARVCGGACVDLTTEENCGACGNRCPAGAVCEGGACACGLDELVCGGVCTDVTTLENCGACGNRCPQNSVCTEGECQCDGIVCDDGCRDAGWFIDNPLHCGQCGNACQGPDVCVAGACEASFEWVSLPAGAFDMGSNEGDLDERPVRRVQVPAFELKRTEVTVAEYAACVTAGACTAPDDDRSCNWGVAGRESHPVNCVDWAQARAYAAWAGGRLPTEAEWEYAARSGGQDQEYPWGNEAPTCARAVMHEGGAGCGEGHTWRVCSKPAGNSAHGTCDLAGNVSEWVEDGYGSYDVAPVDGSAQGGNLSRVFRGGAYGHPAGGLRAADRSPEHLGVRNAILGFRLARSAP